jgi:hypothetical protein
VLLKTPTSNLGINGGSQHPDKRKAGGHGPTLAGEAEHLLPTPTASQPGGTPEQMLARKANMPGGPRNTVTDLRMVLELLPTPTTSDAKGGSPGHDGTLADWVTSGKIGSASGSAPTGQQSTAGQRSSDAPHPTHSPTDASTHSSSSG